MADGKSKRLPRPKRSRWTSFVAVSGKGRIARQLQEETNAKHRLRVEHNKDTLLLHLSAEDGKGWTTIAIDRKTREWAMGPGPGRTNNRTTREPDVCRGCRVRAALQVR